MFSKLDNNYFCSICWIVEDGRGHCGILKYWIYESLGFWEEAHMADTILEDIDMGQSALWYHKKTSSGWRIVESL